MSQTIKISDEYERNVANIQISEKTKVLLQCRAKLSDVYQTVSEIIYSRYSEDSYKAMFEGFENKHCDLDNELVRIISMFIEVTSLESNYIEL